ncbi:hypothetical protein HG531_007242 [Fusarium graminearum]|nr:hypothetical protein HG531_007242 [Fusarium graminearum]
MYATLPFNHQRLWYQPHLISRESRRARVSGKRKLGLHKHLLHTILLLLKLVIHLVKILQPDAVRQHLSRIKLAPLDHLQKLIPVLVNGGLAIADEANSALHQGSDVEVVRVADIHARHAAPSVIANALDHLVDNLARVRLGTDGKLDCVHPALGVLARHALDGAVGAAVTRKLFEAAHYGGFVGHTVGQLLEVDQLQLVLVFRGPALANKG